MSTPESEAIPYEPNDLRGERLLVLAPHPDDEVIGCGGLIALHLRERRTVHVVVVTDGAEAGDAAVREEESRRGLEIAGGPTVEFLRYRDRQLDADITELQQRLRAIIGEFKPDLIAVPSPVEIHPDHIALSRAFCELIQHDPLLFADHAVARIAFYEVSAMIRPNAIVDISPVADIKYQAIEAHESQRAFRNYVAYAQGLNAYRGMTMPPDVRFAEAYWVTPLPQIRTTPFTALRDAVGAPRPLEVVAEPLPISVVIRTKDRPALLADAVDSVRRSGYPAEVVIVNDGGAKPSIAGATIINHDASLGRSAAMNAGVRAAASPFIAFLDDDDLYYAEHLPALANAARKTPATAWYTDAISAFVRSGETVSRMRIFGQDFDREQLLLDNYIPLVTLLVPRDDFLAIEGFDPRFDLFEDWDFLIRLSERGPFAHIPRITCEIRHIEGAGSITLAAPEGSARFREAKLQVWRKHAGLIDNHLIANVLEQQKRRLSESREANIEVRGERDRLRHDIARLERDKAKLIEDSGALHMHAAQAEGASAALRSALSTADADRQTKAAEIGHLQAQVAALHASVADAMAAFEESKRTATALYAEVARLQNLLDIIYQSRTWKLHSMVEKIKGR